ncbi:unnamed protein product [Schistocephalus solidus]|uniref:Secreted protein n=1 Tax=Schistocephalus solidus TaxID=70667 RepID=A0A183SNL6_SCHSO|nr:unnamed protein product [Schistocephalus solidus]
MKILLVLLSSVCLFANAVRSEEEAIEAGLNTSVLTVTTEEKGTVNNNPTAAAETTTDTVSITSSDEMLVGVSTTTPSSGAESAPVASDGTFGFGEDDDDNDADGWVVVSAEELSKLMDEIEAEGRQNSARKKGVQEEVVTPGQ